MAVNIRIGGRKNKTAVIIIAACVVIIVLLAALIFVILRKDAETEDTPFDPSEQFLSNGVLKYDEGAFALDEDSFQKQVDEMVQKVEDGYISLTHNAVAVSSDGENFDCYIENSTDNQYDMYINIYKDATGEEQVLLTGLIPPGSGINKFKSEVKLDKGVYDALLVITQVEDDHKTIRNNQLLLTYSLVVN